MSIWAEVRIWQELINKPQAYANGSASPPYKDRTARPSRDTTYQAHQVLRTTLLPQLRLTVRTPYWLVYQLYTPPGVIRYTSQVHGYRQPALYRQATVTTLEIERREETRATYYVHTYFYIRVGTFHHTLRVIYYQMLYTRERSLQAETPRTPFYDYRTHYRDSTTRKTSTPASGDKTS